MSTATPPLQAKSDWLQTVRALGFKVCETKAVECPRCHLRWKRRNLTSGHSLEVCPGNVRQPDGRHAHCNTHLFLLRFSTDAGPKVLSIALENARAKDLLLSILEPDEDDRP